MMDLTSINWALIAPIIVVQLILMTIALIDCVRIERTNGPKVMWVLIIIFVNIFGPIAYFLFGRRAD
ncbi:PLD nuclease N-terminal domain-containing protein [Anaerobacillus isosaccharinicus]|uniref:PLDc_N domain-containing protein n=1 Tax=Anaerobacillus isosaccharinicus TaxID=1532552 RepID=A0A1S2M809_9BACI|nr:PLD nuclease N-terminal domain-containing protein [Anaerobacillus isosaccharinicus]MBA5588392.1 PLDc_N domain-containing protein [Anaerobacillus isosaccharinicus]QOY38176.1 PLDc_N domain-containing protein [Anaerobacillus isosaccharinicus]